MNISQFNDFISSVLHVTCEVVHLDNNTYGILLNDNYPLCTFEAANDRKLEEMLIALKTFIPAKLLTA